MKAQFLCLAKSWKRGGYCIAGKRFKNKQVLDWVRPVSDHDEGGLSDKDCRYREGGLPNMLDWIECGIRGYCPDGAQKENCYIDKKPWVNYGCYRGPFDPLCDHPATLWGTGCETRDGVNDRVLAEDANFMDQSLYFIKPEQASVVVQKEAYDDSSKKRTRFSFVYNGSNYLFKITDVDKCTYYGDLDCGAYPLKKCYITISLSMPYKDYCYKLVSGLIV